MPKGLYVPFEDALLKAALKKHVHHSDWQLGQAAGRPRAGSVWRRRITQAHEFAQQLDCEEVGQGATGNSDNSYPGQCRARCKDDANLQNLQQIRTTNPDGTIDLIFPTKGPYTVRCGISSCIDTTTHSHSDVHEIFGSRCQWKRSTELGINTRGKKNRTRASSSMQPISTGSGMKARQDSETLNASRRRPSHVRAQPLSFFARTSDTWMRHIPGGEHPTCCDITLGDMLKLSSPKKVEEPARQAIYSDVAALIYARDVRGGDDVDHTALDLVHWVPDATLIRWRKMLLLSDETVYAIARKLAQVLTQKPRWFEVVAQDAVYIDERAVIRVVQPKTAIDGGSNTAGGNWISHEDIVIVDPASPRALRAHRWLGIIPLLFKMEAIAKSLAEIWEFTFDMNRTAIVAAAIERAESVQLCGGLATAGDRVRPRAIDPESSYVPRRGLGGISAEWLVEVLTEAADDDHLEAGDSLRLLANICASMAVAKPEKEIYETTELPPNQTSARSLVCSSEASDISEPDRGSIVAEQIPMLNSRAWMQLCRTHGLVLPIDSSEAALGEVEVDLVEQLTATARFREVSELVSGSLGGFPELALTGVCDPLILEFLLQGMAARRHSSPAYLIGDILWKECGWDTPLGRWLLRRLCRTFDSYAPTGMLSRTAFYRLAMDAGWTTQRDRISRNNRFVQIFSEVTEGNQQASFLDFAHMMELVAAAIIAPVLRKMGHKHVFWPALEIVVLQLNASVSAAARRMKERQGAITVKQKAAQRSRNSSRRPSLGCQSEVADILAALMADGGLDAALDEELEPSQHQSSDCDSELHPENVNDEYAKEEELKETDEEDAEENGHEERSSNHSHSSTEEQVVENESSPTEEIQVSEQTGYQPPSAKDLRNEDQSPAASRSPKTLHFEDHSPAASKSPKVRYEDHPPIASKMRKSMDSSEPDLLQLVVGGTSIKRGD